MIMSEKACAPCDMAKAPLTPDEVADQMARIAGWAVEGGNAAIIREWKFKNFVQALDFVNKIGELAEAMNHHPDLTLGWGYVGVRLLTHSVNGVQMGDIALAEKINQLGE